MAARKMMMQDQMEMTTEAFSAQLSRQLTGARLCMTKHGVFVRSGMPENRTLVVIAHGTLEPNSCFSNSFQSIDNIGFVAPKGHVLLSSLNLLARNSRLAISEAISQGGMIDEHAITPLSSTELRGFCGHLSGNRDYFFVTQAATLSGLITSLSCEFSGDLILHVCRHGGDAGPVDEAQEFVPFSTLSKDSLSLIGFGRDSNGNKTSTDTGEVKPGAESYSKYVSDYLADLADEVAKLQTPTLNKGDEQWKIQKLDLDAAVDDSLIKLAREIGIGRQLGFFNQDLIPRLQEFRQQVQSVVNHQITLPIDDVSSTFSSIPGHNLDADRNALTLSVQRANEFVDKFTDAQRGVLDKKGLWATEDMSKLVGLETDVSHGLPLSSASTKAFGIFEKLDNAVAALANNKASDTNLSATQNDQINDWYTSLTPELAIQRLQQGGKVVLVGAPVERNTLAEDVSGSFEHIVETNIPGLYVGYNSDPKEASAAVSRINAGLNPTNPDHANFSRQLYGAAQLSEINGGVLNETYPISSKQSGFVFGIGSSDASVGVQSHAEFSGSHVSSVITAVATPEGSKTDVTAELYRQLAKVSSHAAFEKVDTASDTPTVGNRFEVKLNSEHAFQWSTAEDNTLARGVGFLGRTLTNSAAENTISPIGSASERTYRLAVGSPKSAFDNGHTSSNDPAVGIGLANYEFPGGSLVSPGYATKVGIATLSHALQLDPPDAPAAGVPAAQQYATVLTDYLNEGAGPTQKYTFAKDKMLSRAIVDNAIEISSIGGDPSELAEGIASVIHNDDEKTAGLLKTAAAPFQLLVDADTVNGNPIQFSAAARTAIHNIYGDVNPAFELTDARIVGGDIRYVNGDGALLEAGTTPNFGPDADITGYNSFQLSNGSTAYLPTDGNSDDSIVVSKQLQTRISALYSDDTDISPQDIGFSFQYLKALATARQGLTPGTMLPATEELTENQLIYSVGSKLTLLKHANEFKDEGSNAHKAYNALEELTDDYLTSYAKTHDSSDLHEMLVDLGPEFTPAHFEQLEKDRDWLTSKDPNATDDQIKTSFSYWASHIEDEQKSGGSRVFVSGNSLFESGNFDKVVTKKIKLLQDVLDKPIEEPHIDFREILEHHESPYAARQRQIQSKEAANKNLTTLLDEVNTYLKRQAPDNPSLALRLQKAILDGAAKNQGSYEIIREHVDIPIPRGIRGNEQFELPNDASLGAYGGTTNAQTDGIFRAFFAGLVDDGDADGVMRITRMLRENYREVFSPYGTAEDYYMGLTGILRGAAGDEISDSDDTSPRHNTPAFPKRRKIPRNVEFKEGLTEPEFVERFNTSALATVSKFAEDGIDASPFIEALDEFADNFVTSKPLSDPKPTRTSSEKLQVNSASGRERLFGESGILGVIQNVDEINGHKLIINPHLRRSIADKRIASDISETGVVVQKIGAQQSDILHNPGLSLEDASGNQVTNIELPNGDLKLQGYTRLSLNDGLTTFISDADPAERFSLSKSVTSTIGWLNADGINGSQEEASASIDYHQFLVEQGIEAQATLQNALVDKVAVFANAGKYGSKAYQAVVDSLTTEFGKLESTNPLQAKELQASLKNKLSAPDSFIEQTAQAEGDRHLALNRAFPDLDPAYTIKKKALSTFAESLGLDPSEVSGIEPTKAGYASVLELGQANSQEFDGFHLVNPTAEETVSLQTSFEAKVATGLSNVIENLTVNGTDINEPIAALADIVSSDVNGADITQHGILKWLGSATEIDGHVISIAPSIESTLNKAVSHLPAASELSSIAKIQSISVDGSGYQLTGENGKLLPAHLLGSLTPKGTAEGFHKISLSDGSQVFLPNSSTDDGFVLSADAFADITWLDSNSVTGSPQAIAKSLAFAEQYAANQSDSDAAEVKLVDSIGSKLSLLKSAGTDANDARNSLAEQLNLGEIKAPNLTTLHASNLYEGVNTDNLPLLDVGGGLAGFTASDTSSGSTVYSDGKVRYAKTDLPDGRKLFVELGNDDARHSFVVGQDAWNEITWFSGDHTLSSSQEVNNAVSYARRLSQLPDSPIAGQFEQLLRTKLDQISDTSKPTYNIDEVQAVAKALNWREVDDVGFDANGLYGTPAKGSILRASSLPEFDGLTAPEGYTHYHLGDGRGLYVSDDHKGRSVITSAHAEEVLTYLSSDAVSDDPALVSEAVTFAKDAQQFGHGAGESFNQLIHRKIDAYVSSGETDSASFQQLLDSSGVPTITDVGATANGQPLLANDSTVGGSRLSSLPLIDIDGTADGFQRIKLPNGNTLYKAENGGQDFVVGKLAEEGITWLQSSNTSTETPLSVKSSYEYALALVKSGHLSKPDFENLVQKKLQALSDEGHLDGNGPLSVELQNLRSAFDPQSITAVNVDSGRVSFVTVGGASLATAEIPEFNAKGAIDGYQKFALSNGETLFVSSADDKPSFSFGKGVYQHLFWLTSDDTDATSATVTSSIEYFRSQVKSGEITATTFNKLIAQKMHQFELPSDVSLDEETLATFVDEAGYTTINSVSGNSSGVVTFGDDYGGTVTPGSLPALNLHGDVVVGADTSPDGGRDTWVKQVLANGAAVFTRQVTDELDGIPASLADTSGDGSTTTTDGSGSLHTPTSSASSPPESSYRSVVSDSSGGVLNKIVLAPEVYKTITWLTSGDTGAPPAVIDQSVQYASALAQTDSEKQALIHTVGEKLIALSKAEDDSGANLLGIHTQDLIETYGKNDKSLSDELTTQLKGQLTTPAAGDALDVVFPGIAIKDTLAVVGETDAALQQIGTAAIEGIEDALGINLIDRSVTSTGNVDPKAILAQITLDRAAPGFEKTVTPENLKLADNYTDVLKTVVDEQSAYAERLYGIDTAIVGHPSTGDTDTTTLISRLNSALPVDGGVFTPEVLKRLNALGGIRDSAFAASKGTSKAIHEQISDIQAEYEKTTPLAVDKNGRDISPEVGDAGDFNFLAQIAKNTLGDGFDDVKPIKLSLKSPLSADVIKQALGTVQAEPTERALAIMKGHRLAERFDKSVTDIAAKEGFGSDYVPILGTAELIAPKPGAPDSAGLRYQVDFIDTQTQVIKRVVTADNTIYETRQLLDEGAHAAAGNDKIRDQIGSNPEIEALAKQVGGAEESNSKASRPVKLFGSGSGEEDDTDVGGVSTLNAAFAIQSLNSYFQRNKVEHSTQAPGLAKVLRIHEDLNLARVFYGVTLDAAHLVGAVKTLYSQSTKTIGTTAETAVEASSFGTAFSTAGQIGLGAVDTAFSAASTGLDIYELTKAKSGLEKSVLGTQLAFDSAGTVIGATSLGLSVASVAGVTAAASIGAVIGGAGVIFAGIGVGVAALVQAFGEIVDEAKQVGKYFNSVHETYENSGFTYDSKSQTLTTKGQGSVDEVNFRTGKVTYGNTKAASIKRTKYDHSEGKGGRIDWGGEPDNDNNTADDFDLYSAMGYNKQVNLKDSSDAKVLVAPVTPHSRFHNYTYNQDAGAPFQNDTGFAELRHIERTENFDFDFYAWPTSYILQKGDQDYSDTAIKIVLDNKPRVVIVPPIPKAYGSHVSHHILGDGNQYAIGVGDRDHITLDSDAGKKSTWVINTANLTNDGFSVTSDGINFSSKSGSPKVTIADKDRATVLLDDSEGDTFVINVAQKLAAVVSIDGNKYSTHEKLTAHLDHLRSEKRLGTQVRITNYRDEGDKKDGTAVYDSKSNTFVSDTLVREGAQVVEVNAPAGASGLLSAGLVAKSIDEKSVHETAISASDANTSGKSGWLIKDGVLYHRDLATGKTISTYKAPELAKVNGASSGELGIVKQTSNGLQLLYQQQWGGNNAQYIFNWNNASHRFELQQINGDSSIYDHAHYIGEKFDLKSLQERFTNPVALSGLVSVSLKNQTTSYIEGDSGYVIKPQLKEDEFLEDHVYKLKFNPGSIPEAKKHLKYASNFVNQNRFYLQPGQSFDFHDAPTDRHWKVDRYLYHSVGDFFKGAFGDGQASAAKNVLDDTDENLVHQLSGRIYLKKGTHTFSFHHDDDLEFSIAGKTLIDSSSPNNDWVDTNYTADHDGFYAISGLNTQGQGGASLGIRIDGKDLTIGAAPFQLAAKEGSGRDSKTLFFDPRSQQFYVVSSYLANAAALPEINGTTEHYVSFGKTTDGKVLATTNQGNVFEVGIDGKATLEQIGAAWLKGHKDPAGALETLVDSDIARDQILHLQINPDSKENAVYDSAAKSWFLLPQGVDNEHDRLLSIDPSTGSTWYFNPDKKQLIRGVATTTQEFADALSSTSKLADLQKTNLALSGAVYSSIKRIPSGILAFTDTGAEIFVSEKGTKQLISVPASWVKQKSNSLKSFLKDNADVVASDAIKVADVKTGTLAGWFFTGNKTFYTANFAAGLNKQFLGIDVDGHGYGVANDKDGQQSLYQLDGAKAEKRFSASLIERISGRTLVGAPQSSTLAVALTPGQTLSDIPSLKDTNQLVLSIAAGDTLSITEGLLLSYSSVTVDVSQMDTPASPAAASRNSQQETTPVINLDKSWLSNKTLVTERNGKLSIFDGENSKLIQFTGYDASTPVKLIVGDNPPLTIGQLDHSINQYGFDLGQAYLHGDIYFPSKPVHSIADLQNVVSHEKGTGYSIKSLYFDESGRGKGNDTISAFLGGHATLDNKSDDSILQHKDEHVIHQIAGSVYLTKGIHKLSIRHDDGLKFSIGTKVLADKFGSDHGKTHHYEFSADKTGYFPVEALYYQATKRARLVVELDGRPLSPNDPNAGGKGISVESLYTAASIDASEKNVSAEGDNHLKDSPEKSVVGKLSSTANSSSSALNQHNLDKLVQAMASFDGKPDAQIADKELINSNRDSGLAADPTQH
ncbi:Toxin B [BD1-7 clade bacterium]|uniref:Toxin B n=1 Tax=BD1-7 clade bacterium TaxID=2029982 RepID=A0A5S9QMR4_9GAMM|nr:Toxin B [BD1-7 clade bacterium]